MDKSYILHTGEVKALDNVGDQMLISGWASTKDIDLSGDIVLPTAFAKHWDFYAKKGRYWFNHDPNIILGHVKQARLLPDGFYIDQAKLTDNAFNRDFIWPHVKEGALSEHSIQFMSIKPELKDGILYHQEVQLIETSIVSVACNPEAVITGFKGLIPSEDYTNASIEQLMHLDREGKLRHPGKIFAIPGFRSDQDIEEDMENKQITLPAADLVDIKVIARMKTGYDPKGIIKPNFKMPSTKAKTYEEIANLVYLAKSDVRNTHMFRVAVITEKGWRYDWANVAMSMGTILGAKGAANYADGEKLLLFKEMFAIYTSLGKKLPTYEGEALDNLSDEALVELKFHDVEFVEGESEVIRLEVAKSSIKAFADAIAHYRKGGSLPEELVTYAKSVYPAFMASFDIYPSDPESIAFLEMLLDCYQQYCDAREARMNPTDNSMMDAYAYSLTEEDAELTAKVYLARTLQTELQKTLTDLDPKWLEKVAVASEDAPVVEGVTEATKKSWEVEDDDLLSF